MTDPDAAPSEPPEPLPAPLPDGSRLLHVGPPKTGSTSLQMALHAARDELARLGVRYPGPTRKPAGDFGMRPVPGDSARIASDDPSWAHLRAEVDAPGDHRVVAVSLEAWGRADDEGARRVVAEVGGAQPHVLAVARRHDRLMPSAWQQRVKSPGLRLDYEAWLRLVLGPPRPDELEWRAFWLPHDTGALLRRWVEALADAPGATVTLVVPGEDRTLLARTVGALLDVPPGLAAAEGSRNEALAWPSVELARRVHEVAEERGWSEQLRSDAVREGLVRVLARSDAVRSAGGAPVPGPPRWALERLVELGEERVDAVRAAADDLGVRVVGVVDDLRVAPPGPDVPASVTAPDELPLEVAVTALADLLERFAGPDGGPGRRRRRP